MQSVLFSITSFISVSSELIIWANNCLLMPGWRWKENYIRWKWLNEENLSKKDIALQAALDQMTTSFAKGSIMWLGRFFSPRQVAVVYTRSCALDMAKGKFGFLLFATKCISFKKLYNTGILLACLCLWGLSSMFFILLESLCFSSISFHYVFFFPAESFD